MTQIDANLVGSMTSVAGVVASEIDERLNLAAGAAEALMELDCAGVGVTVLRRATNWRPARRARPQRAQLAAQSRRRPDMWGRRRGRMDGFGLLVGLAAWARCLSSRRLPGRRSPRSTGSMQSWRTRMPTTSDRRARRTRRRMADCLAGTAAAVAHRGCANRDASTRRLNFHG